MSEVKTPWTPLQEFGIYFTRNEANCVRDLDLLRPEAQEKTDAAFMACKTELDRLHLLPEGQAWDSDPIKELAAQMYRLPADQIDLTKRRAAKIIFWKCAVAMYPGWGE